MCSFRFIFNQIYVVSRKLWTFNVQKICRIFKNVHRIFLRFKLIGWNDSRLSGSMRKVIEWSFYPNQEILNPYENLILRSGLKSILPNLKIFSSFFLKKRVYISLRVVSNMFWSSNKYGKCNESFIFYIIPT